MPEYPTSSVPISLYVRGVELGLLPRQTELQPHELNWLYQCGATIYRHGTALLAANTVTPEQRDILEQSGLAYARWASSNPLQGAEAYCKLVPYLSPRRQAAARRAAVPVLQKVEQFVSARAFGSPHYTYLRHRELWRVLAPETYPEWLRRQGDRLLNPSVWGGTPIEFRENLAHLHVLGKDYLRGLTLALDGIPFVEDGWVTEDREIGMGGAFAFTAAQVEAADREAQTKALQAIAPLLPPELHPCAADLSARLEIELPDTLGERLADPLASRGLLWYYSLPEEPIPWLTVAERQPLFAALDASTRNGLVATLVEDCVAPTGEYPGEVAQRAHPEDPARPRRNLILDEDLPVAAPYLNVEQTQRLLDLWGLPEGRYELELPDDVEPSPF